jgi:hypothetical protein
MYEVIEILKQEFDSVMAKVEDDCPVCYADVERIGWFEKRTNRRGILTLGGLYKNVAIICNECGWDEYS